MFLVVGLGNPGPSTRRTGTTSASWWSICLASTGRPARCARSSGRFAKAAHGGATGSAQAAHVHEPQRRVGAEGHGVLQGAVGRGHRRARRARPAVREVRDQGRRRRGRAQRDQVRHAVLRRPGFVRACASGSGGLGRGRPEGHVLSDFSSGERAELPDVLERAAAGVEGIVSGGRREKAMNRDHKDPGQEQRGTAGLSGADARHDRPFPRSGPRAGAPDREEKQWQAQAVGDERAQAREYETIYILKPRRRPTRRTKRRDPRLERSSLASRASSEGGQLGQATPRVPISKHARHVRLLPKYVGYSDLVAEIERNLRMLDASMRFQTVRVEEATSSSRAYEAVDPAEVKFGRHRGDGGRGGGGGRPSTRLRLRERAAARDDARRRG